MWVEELNNGRFKFVEQYKCPLTHKYKKVSITLDKNTTATRKKANKILLDKIELKKASVNLNTMRLVDLSEFYLSDKKKTVSITSYNNYVKNINSLFKRIDKNIIVNNLNIVVVKKLLENAPITCFNTLRLLMKYAFDNDIIADDVAKKMRLHIKQLKGVKGATIKDKKLYYENDELNSIFNTLDNEKGYYAKLLRLLIEFLVLSGLRIGEALALLDSDVDANTHTIDINKSITETLIHLPKSDTSIRSITVNNRAMQIISELRFLKRMYRIDSPVLFASPRGKHCNAKYLATKLKQYGLPTTFHIYRHTHATILAEKGINLETIQRRLGHEDSEITKKIYIHITNRQINKEKELFSFMNIL